MCSMTLCIKCVWTKNVFKHCICVLLGRFHTSFNQKEVKGIWMADCPLLGKERLVLNMEGCLQRKNIGWIMWGYCHCSALFGHTSAMDPIIKIYISLFSTTWAELNRDQFIFSAAYSQFGVSAGFFFSVGVQPLQAAQGGTQENSWFPSST